MEDLHWGIKRRQEHDTAIAEVDLDGEPIRLELRYGPFGTPSSIEHVDRRIAETREYWFTWADRLHLPNVATDQVRRSALILKALCFSPSGGMAAAGTTSLPEHLGGTRNWDSRATKVAFTCAPRGSSKRCF